MTKLSDGVSDFKNEVIKEFKERLIDEINNKLGFFRNNIRTEDIIDLINNFNL